MNTENIISGIDEQNSELRNLKTIFGLRTNRFDGFVNLDKIDRKIFEFKRAYYFFLALSLFIAIPLYVTGIAQAFDSKLIDLSISGLAIASTFVNILWAFRFRMDMLKLNMIKNLLGIKQKLEKE